MKMRRKVSVVQECFDGKQKGCKLLYHFFRLTNSPVVNEGINGRETTTDLPTVSCSSGILNRHTFVREEGEELLQVRII